MEIPASTHTTNTEQTTPKGQNSSVSNPATRVIVPAIPTVKAPAASRNAGQGSVSISQARQSSRDTGQVSDVVPPPAPADGDGGTELSSSTSVNMSPETVAKATPKSWADLVRMKAPNPASAPPQPTDGTDGLPIHISGGKSGSLAEALSSYNVEDSRNANKVSFLEPRGLVNTGNTCYINSVSHKCW